MKPELFQKVYTKDRLPDKDDLFIWHHISGKIYHENLFNKNIELIKKSFDWWLEELPIPSDEDIENHYLKGEPRGYGCSYYNGLVNGAKGARDGKIHIQNK
jgi:hypothetical protein